MIILSFLFVGALAQNCLNQYGQSVDWWIIFKLPQDSSAGHIGMEYFYCDSKDCSTLIQMHDYLYEQSSPLQQTIAQIDFHSSTAMSVTWSDQPYNKATVSSKAHSKGVLSASTNGKAFIINHSTPNFPLFDGNYDQIELGMPDSAKVYGQHYMCVELTTSEANKIAESYIIAEIITNRANDISSFASAYPNIHALKDSSRHIPAENGHIIATSRGGLKFHVVSTNQKYTYDFYASLVAPSLKVGLVVETWGNGAGGLQDPDCSTQYQTMSNLVRLYNGYQFKYTKDHSKFGISINHSLPYVCMSDINRQISQNKRGGTTFCFLDGNLWNHINAMFVERQQC